MKAPTPSLDIIGGAYDHLAPLTEAGRRRLGAVEIILHPPRIFPSQLSRLNPGATLVPAAGKEGLRDAADELRRRGGDTALLLPDTVSSPGILRKAALLEKDGFRVSLHHALPLADAAAIKAGFPPGEARAAAIPAAQFAGEEWREHLTEASASGVTAVGFDGRVLWPARVVPAEGLPLMGRLLPEEGTLFVMPCPPADGAFPRPRLAGRGILVTRALEQADELGMPLLARGATPFYFPTIAITAPEDRSAAERAVEGLGNFDAVIFTSANTVEHFLALILGRGLDLRALGGRRIMAVGARTAGALRERGLAADAVPADFRAEGLVALLETEGAAGKRFLLPRAEEGREILPDRIRELGGEVEVVTLYRTLPASPDVGELQALHGAGLLDAVVFTSGSTFNNFLEIAGSGLAAEILGRAAVACIGPVTAAAIRTAGHHVTVMPERSTVPDLVAALEDHFS